MRMLIAIWGWCVSLSLYPSMMAGEPIYRGEQIFPLMEKQTHAPGIVQFDNGDLMASWYGDDEDADGAVWGARWDSRTQVWGPPFVMADRKGFADGNTCMMVDRHGKLWLFWPTILGGSWESSLVNYRVALQPIGSGVPDWTEEGLILLKPKDFSREALERLGGATIRPPRGAINGPEGQKAKLKDPLYQRLGWIPRCKPTVLPNGRILLPLYTDTFAISIMAISDDGGRNWFTGNPILGFGSLQPTVLRRNDGTLVAYMRDASGKGRMRVATSQDEGLTWGEVTDGELPNPGSGIDGVRLDNGHWVMVYNDSAKDRTTLAVSLSTDEGKTWSHTRHLEQHAAGRYHYPAVIQGTDGLVHVVYSCFVADATGASGESKKPDQKGIKHVVLNEAWVEQGD